MRLSELCIRRPVMTTLLMASLLLAGFFGYRQLPIAAIPRIEVPTIAVTVDYPGASRPPWQFRSRPRWNGSSPHCRHRRITAQHHGRCAVTLEFDLSRNIPRSTHDGHLGGGLPA
jgi:HAE1 family hydrophobic/amphiphilic exporter-1